MDRAYSSRASWISRIAQTLALNLAALLVLAGAAVAANAPRVQESALSQMQILKGIKANKSPQQNKIDSRLFLGMLKGRGDASLAPLTSFRFVRPEADGLVPVDILVKGPAGVKAATNLVLARGGVLKDLNYQHKILSARVHLEDLEALSAIADVKKIRQAMPAYTRGATNVSEGDVTHGADETRGFFGVTGLGVKVCVLSDGVDSLAALQASGDLPAVDVLPGQAGAGDEGSAMLEIVHDLAPGATLGFATAFTSEASFAQNILDLATDGCNVIVDDVIYLDESPFQDGPVAQSVNTVTAGGVIYFSSSGNEGNVNDQTSGTWEGDFLASAAADPAPLAGANLHDFGDGNNSILVEFGGGNPPLLIWAEHYDLATGAASTDFDVYDMDGGLTTIFDASTDVQDGVGGDDFPIEFIGGGTFGGERLLVDLFAAGATSSLPMFNLIVFRGELDDNLVTPGTTRGHSAAVAAFSTAATPAAASFDGVTPDGPFPGLFTNANETESFTADGPRRVILDPAGAELTPGNRTSTGGTVRQKPDITAADGVSTAAPGFNPFYGTSAAAPHAAALAALCKSAVPSITPAALRTALTSSAIDIETAGVDRDTGAGIVMAHAFLNACGAVPQALLDAGAAVPTQVAGDGDAFIEINETWSLIIPLTNIGGVGATAISGNLTTGTPGITVGVPNSAYPDLAVSASGNNATAYQFTVGAAAVCGDTIDFTLTATYTGGPSPQAFNFSLGTGQPGTPVAFSYSGPVVPIPDSPGGPVDATLAVAGVVGNILDVNFSIDGTVCSTADGSTTVGIDHTFVADLDVTLISPATTGVVVIDNTDGGGNNFCQTALDDQSGGPNIQSVATADAPFTGSFVPNAPLAGFSGETANGNWILRAEDFAGIDTGSIRAFTVTITPAVCNAPALSPIITGTKTITGGNQNQGGNVIYTIVLTNSGTGAQLDNAGNEFTDTLPAGLTVGVPTATSGTVSASGVNPVTWNGTIPASGSVTITIPATIANGTAGLTLDNQGQISYDADGNGTNDTAGVTDGPAAPVGDPTSFVVGAGSVLVIPTVSTWGLLILAAALAAAALFVMKK
jgi:uncharacterized repeat protein (TIGR01451 family)